MNAGKRAVENFQADFLQRVENNNLGDVDALLSRLDVIQEQPQLLDEYIQPLIDLVLACLTKTLLPAKLSKFDADLYTTLYYFTKIRGAKVIIKLLPNDVHLLQPIITCLLAQDRSDRTLWQARYILLLWLSLVCMAPFSMTTFDRGTKNLDSAHVGTVDRILQIGEMFMGESSREREAAGLLIARLLSRKDVNEKYIPEFLSKSLKRWNSSSTNYRTGLLTCLSEIYKIGNRDVLLFHSQSAVDTMREIETTEELMENTLLRKLRVKFAQRIALALLPPNLASWRYRNNPKSLDNEQSIFSIPCESGSTEPSTEVEEILGLLLESLNDKDTIVRYSAAKGIGRLTIRLPIQYAEEVVDAIMHSLEITTKTEMPQSRLQLADIAQDSTWHGACLAIAELCRSGALMPSCLARMFPLVFLALRFDIKKGSHSIGTSVRDAACYAMWSILRCYKTDLLQPYGSAIANALVVVALFDREISVRRAASAAYQEGVGRHPDNVFPDGIAILLLADFIAVGQRRSSFLEVAPAVFLYPAYHNSILTFLTTTSCLHWDREIRELAGQSLQMIIISGLKQSSGFLETIQNTIKTLSDYQQSLDVSARHGSIYALGKICAALQASTPNLTSGYLSPCLERLQEIGKHISDHNFRGPTAGLMYCGVCHFVARISQLEASVVQVHEGNVRAEVEVPQEIQEKYLKLSIDALSLSDGRVVHEATDALFCLYTFTSCRAKITTLILENYDDNTNSAIAGWMVLYGKIDYDNAQELLFNVVRQTVQWAQITGDKTRDNPDRRKVATGSFQHLISQMAKLAETGRTIVHESLELVLNSLSQGLNDYTIDARGDVGSWVREAAVRSSCALFEHLELLINVVDASDRSVSLLVALLSQCLGKIDNLRASTTFALTSALRVALLQEQDLSRLATFEALCKTIMPVLDRAAELLNAGAPSITTFEDLAPLLAVEALRSALIKEYLISGSSGSQSTMTAASTSLSSYLDDQESSFLNEVLADIVSIIGSSKDDDRVLVPVLDSTANLFESQIFANVDFDLERLFVTIQNATPNTRTIPKIFAALKCYAALAITPHTIRHRAWKKLTLTLAHKFPRVRVLAAELLYSVLSYRDLEALEENTKVVEALTEEDWALDIEKEKVDVVKAFTLP